MPDGVTLGRRIGVTDEWLRVWRVIIFNKGGAAALLAGELGEAASGSTAIFSSEMLTGQYPGIETYAAGLRCTFTVTMATSQTPNTAEITLYNLADASANNLIEEYNYVILQAGYEWGQAGTIFTGTIKFWKKGHDAATDSYLKIYAADGDQAINRAVINTTLPEGTTAADKLDALRKTMEPHDVTTGYIEEKALVKHPGMRPETLYGMTADRMRDFANQNGALWYILDQKLYWAKPTSYDPGAIVQLTALNGLIGFPESTQDGINVQCLINPAIRLRQRIHLDNQYINQYFQPGGESGGYAFGLGGYQTKTYYAPVAQDGIYVPLSIQYEGDSRGGSWTQSMTCLAVDTSQDDLLKAIIGALDWNQLT